MNATTTQAPEVIEFAGSKAEILCDLESLALARIALPAGHVPPLHVHRYEDETFYVLEGSITLFVEGAEPVRLSPGEATCGPRGVPHAYEAGPDGCTVLVAASPGGFAGFVRAAAGDRSPEELTRIGAEFGIDILGPPGARP